MRNIKQRAIMLARPPDGIAHYLGALEQLAPLVAQHRATFDQDRRLLHVVCIDIVRSERGGPLVQAPAGEGGFGSKISYLGHHFIPN